MPAISEICVVRRQTIDPREFPDELFEYYSIPALQATGGPTSEFGRNIRSQKVVVSYPTVLFGKLNPRVPKIYRVLHRSAHRQIATTEFICLEPKHDVDTEYLFYACSWRRVIAKAQQLTSGSTPSRQRVDPSSFGDIEIPVPSLPKQRAIAAILSKLQERIDVQTRILGTLNDLKIATMAQLFTEYSWREVALGQIAKIGNGSTPRRDESRYWTGGTLPWLTSGKIHEGIIELADEFVTEAARSECHLPLVPSSSILIAITGQGKTLGNAALVTFQTCVSQHLAYIIIESGELLPEFLLAFLQSRYDDLRAVGQSGGTTKGALTCGYLKTLTVPVPAIDEQRTIASTCKALFDVTRVARMKQCLLQELFNGTLDEIMSGEIDATVLVNDSEGE